MIARRNFFFNLFGSLIATAFMPAAALAVTKTPRRRTAAPSPSPDPAAPPEKANTPARIRLWKVNDASDRTVQIRLLPSGRPESEALSPLKVEAGNYQFSDYTQVPSGPFTVEVSAPERATILLPVHLASGGQSTLLVRLLGATLSTDWIDDTPSPVDSGCEFSIYNLLFTSGDVQIDMGTILTVHLSSTHSSLHLNGIKKGNYPVVANGTDGTGKSFHWNTDADLRQARKATLLIYPDAYGRIRPRINSV